MPTTLSVSGDPSGLVDVASGLDIVLGMNGGVVEGWVGGDSSIVAFTVSVDGSGNVTLDQLRANPAPPFVRQFLDTRPAEPTPLVNEIGAVS